MFRLLLFITTLTFSLPTVAMQTKVKNLAKLNTRNYAQMTKENFKNLVHNERPLPSKIFAAKLALMEKDIDDLKYIQWALSHNDNNSTDLNTLNKKMHYNKTLAGLYSVSPIMVLGHSIMSVGTFYPLLMCELIIAGLNTLQATQLDPIEINALIPGVATYSPSLAAIGAAALTLFTYHTHSGKGAFYVNCLAKNKVYRNLRRQEANVKHVGSLITDSYRRK